MENDEKMIIESFIKTHKYDYIDLSMYIFEAMQCLSSLKDDNLNTNKYLNEHYCELIMNEISNSQEQEKFKWPYSVAPYFTEEEILQFKNYYHESDDSEPRAHDKKIEIYEDELKKTNDPDEIHRIKDILYSLGWNDDHVSFMMEGEATNFNPRTWNKKLVTLLTKLREEDDPEKIGEIKQEIISLGWNPEVDYTAENMVMAKKRIERIYQEKYSITELNIQSLIEDYNMYEPINENAKNANIKPIHIVLVRGDNLFSGVISKITNGDFSHSAICIDNDFNRLYSFNMDKSAVNYFTGGFSLESIKEYPQDKRLAVFSFFVKDEDYKKISEKLQSLLLNSKSTSYSFANVFTFPFKNIKINMGNAMICSQFVDSILKLCNVDVTNIDSSKVSPNLLYKKSINNPKVYKIFDGYVKDFNAKKSQAYIERMAKRAKPAFTESNIFTDYIYPVVLEAKKSAIEFNDNGDLLLTNKFINFDSEYSASHKLLLQYEKVNNLNGIKYELARLYYMNYILEKRLYHKRYLRNKDKNIKTRARVLNDFNKYLKLLLKKEPNFNFAEYYENSVFYAHTVEIKNSTLLKLKEIISGIL